MYSFEITQIENMRFYKIKWEGSFFLNLQIQKSKI